jgi:hypothetical protein
MIAQQIAMRAVDRVQIIHAPIQLPACIAIGSLFPHVRKVRWRSSAALSGRYAKSAAKTTFCRPYACIFVGRRSIGTLSIGHAQYMQNFMGQTFP